MSRYLPPNPNLDHLKNEAKDLHKSHQQQHSKICPILRRIHRFSSATDEEILAADVSLTECQFALALEYGFPGWQQLRRTVWGTRPGADYHSEPESEAVLLPNVPRGIIDPDRFAAAFTMAINYFANSFDNKLVSPADYNTVLGDCGLAFIFQADSLHKPHGADVEALDMGWWPLDPWGAMLRLDFLRKVYGINLIALPADTDAWLTDAARHYRTYHEAQVNGCLQAGLPAIGIVGGDVYLIIGCDEGYPPLLGQLSCEDRVNIQRLERYPWMVILTGSGQKLIDRRTADVQALDYAVKLGRDDIRLDHLPGKSSGKRSWKLWTDQLAKESTCGPNFYHANVIGHLIRHRREAADYLRNMGERHEPEVSHMLNNAAHCYSAVAGKLRTADISEQAFCTTTGRERLADLITAAEALEVQALGMLETAVNTMR